MLGQGAGLGVLEHVMRAALTAAGGRLLEAVLAGDTGYQGPQASCGRGHQAAFAGCRPKTVTTVLGPVRVTRAWYHCGQCGRGFAPRDGQPGVAGTSLSPGLAEMIARAGAEVPFGKAAALLADLAGITMNAKTIERAAEAAGAAARAAGTAEAAALRAREILPLPPLPPVPDMLYVETDGTGVRSAPADCGPPGQGRRRHGPHPGDQARPAVTQAGPAARAGWSWTRAASTSPPSTARTPWWGWSAPRTCAAAGTTSARSSPRRRRGVDRTMVEALYPHATHIVDIYHAREHLHDLAAHLAFITPGPPQWLAARLDDLDAGNIEAIIGAARQYPLDGIKAEDLDKKLHYFEHNIHRMRYARFRNLGMFTGSGAIEAACKQIVAARAKQSGMHWTVEGAADIIALRCQHASGRWDELWPAGTHTPARPRAAV